MNEKQRQGARVIQERIAPRAIEAFQSNYRDSQQALLELIDNAIDNRIDNKPLTVTIHAKKEFLSVANKGGQGLDFEGLENLFVWGYSEKEATPGRIGLYGVGGKSAMAYLGRSMKVMCSPRGSNRMYTVEDSDWESREEDTLKELSVTENSTPLEDGYFSVRISNLRQNINSQALTAKLEDTYAPLLRSGKVQITVNGRSLQPLEIDYQMDNPDLKPQPMKIGTPFDEDINLKIGVLKEGSSNVKPGLRCYYRGRLIEDQQFFGFPTPAQMPQASRLIGEVHLDFVPVTSNKATFNHSSLQWIHAEERLKQILAPWYEKLKNLKMENLSEVENYENELARNAKRVLEDIFANTKIVTKKDLPGESSGRKSPQQNERPKPTGSHPHEGPRAGRTPPTLDAETAEIKRWGATFKWEVVSMGTIDIRSQVVEEPNRNVLKINADFPLYKTFKNAGKKALELYMAETGILDLSAIVTRDRSKEEYINLVTNLLRDCGLIYERRPSLT